SEDGLTIQCHVPEQVQALEAVILYESLPHISSEQELVSFSLTNDVGLTKKVIMTQASLSQGQPIGIPDKWKDTIYPERNGLFCSDFGEQNTLCHRVSLPLVLDPPLKSITILPREPEQELVLYGLALQVKR
ncbi:hypothetical protein ACFL27_28460, partial [candidate division CSSED10-310 bacterium]